MKFILLAGLSLISAGLAFGTACLRTSDQSWAFPFEPTLQWLMFGALAVTTYLLLWRRVIRVVIPAMAAQLLFASYFAEHHGIAFCGWSFDSLVALFCMVAKVLCPFLAAISIVAWGGDHCRGRL